VTSPQPRHSCSPVDLPPSLQAFCGSLVSFPRLASILLHYLFRNALWNPPPLQAKQTNYSFTRLPASSSPPTTSHFPPPPSVDHRTPPNGAGALRCAG
ncbi:hypothetical protein AMECASPLE_026466, partial [Ameca splendens]